MRVIELSISRLERYISTSEESESSTSGSSWSGPCLPSRRDGTWVSGLADEDGEGSGGYEESEEVGDADFERLKTGCKEKEGGVKAERREGDVGSGTEAAIEVSGEVGNEAGVGVEREECGE